MVALERGESRLPDGRGLVFRRVKIKARGASKKTKTKNGNWLRGSRGSRRDLLLVKAALRTLATLEARAHLRPPRRVSSSVRFVFCQFAVFVIVRVLFYQALFTSVVSSECLLILRCYVAAKKVPERPQVRQASESLEQRADDCGCRPSRSSGRSMLFKRHGASTQTLR